MIPTVLALIVAIGTLAVLAITAARDRRARDRAVPSHSAFATGREKTYARSAGERWHP